MGSSCEANGQSIDSRVGGLVWVRRRNGSWWPGQILAADELPEGCLVLPRRTGTPVKLLGREDATVDWYNLEKSKRVKSFRCGEYDQCIENAKFAAPYTTSSRKGVKYARREDAILQALEIENSQLSTNNNNSETISQTDKTENVSDKLSGLDLISVSPQELPRTSASPDNSEEDGTEGSRKRMRGLHDLGVGRAISSFKKKRTRVAHIHDYLKKKNRRCQLTKVLKKTEMVTIPVMCEELKGGKEYNGLKGYFSDNIINASSCKHKEHENYSVFELLETDDSAVRLFDVPFVREEKQPAGCSSASAPETGQFGTLPQSGQSSLVETIAVGPDQSQESGSISSGADISHIIDRSKWQHKGKRKSRNRRTKTKTMQTFLTPDDESRKVNNTVEVSGPQSLMFFHHTGSLYDVNIDVESCNFPRHLPYISLMSNLTGQRVTGHSLEVEVLNDGVSDLSLNSSECLSSSCELGGVNMVNGDVHTVQEASKKLRKNVPLSNKKIRKLSSLTVSKAPSAKGVLKKPDVACVPLKIVFGRIHAALGISSADVGLTR